MSADASQASIFNIAPDISVCGYCVIAAPVKDDLNGNPGLDLSSDKIVFRGELIGCTPRPSNTGGSEYSDFDVYLTSYLGACHNVDFCGEQEPLFSLDTIGSLSVFDAACPDANRASSARFLHSAARLRRGVSFMSSVNGW